VVDNGSTDASDAVARASGEEVRWLPAGANLGYGAAANLGVAVTVADHVVVCNPDVVVAPEAVAALSAALSADAQLGVVGPRILNSDGTTYPSARCFPNLVDAVGHGLFGLVWKGNPFTRRYRREDADPALAARVDWVSGAFFCARRSAWREVEGFDPKFFMYLEDVDLCWRMGKAGWAVAYQPAAEVVHHQGVATNRHPYRMLAAHHTSLWRFAVRTTTGPRRVALPLIGAGLVGRLGVAWAQHGLSGRGLTGRRAAK
ncbi:MAG: glycosyltransferase, partial [Acidimicrobiales bacterium]